MTWITDQNEYNVNYKGYSQILSIICIFGHQGKATITVCIWIYLYSIVNHAHCVSKGILKVFPRVEFKSKKGLKTYKNWIVDSINSKR